MWDPDFYGYAKAYLTFAFRSRPGEQSVTLALTIMLREQELLLQIIAIHYPNTQIEPLHVEALVTH